MATNAAYADIAYTSFETSQTGNWVISGGNYSSSLSITGRKSYILNSGNTITSMGHASNNFIVSYWSRNGSLTVNGQSGIAGPPKGGWTYYQHVLSGVTGITISVTQTHTIDELRLYPVASQMVTYCYQPLKGISEICDVRNNISYYEYDGMGRLADIRDIDKNILKKINTSLMESGSTGIFYNQQVSLYYARNNCDAGSDGSGMEYTVSAGRYSSRISQEDANAQATAEATNAGQAYANLTGTCIVSCPNCPAPTRHCSNGVCLRGIGVYTSLGYNPTTGKYDCMLHYEFSDGYWSPAELIESDTPCG
jgi:hypothetical protein